MIHFTVRCNGIHREFDGCQHVVPDGKAEAGAGKSNPHGIRILAPPGPLLQSWGPLQPETWDFLPTYAVGPLLASPICDPGVIRKNWDG